jgi:hypothetical protein
MSDCKAHQNTEALGANPDNVAADVRPAVKSPDARPAVMAPGDGSTTKASITRPTTVAPRVAEGRSDIRQKLNIR